MVLTTSVVPLAAEHMEIVDHVLEEIGAGMTPRMVVLNKADLLETPLRAPHGFETVSISALRGEGLDRLLTAVARNFSNLREEISVTLAADRGDLVAMARRDGEILSEEYHDGVVALSSVFVVNTLVGSAASSLVGLGLLLLGIPFYLRARRLA